MEDENNLMSQYDEDDDPENLFSAKSLDDVSK